MSTASVSRFEGASMFRMRLALSTVTGSPVRIEKIRSEDEEPGLRDYEVSLLKLLDKVTNGSVVEVNPTGTVVYYRPGVIIGGDFSHRCPNSRNISWFLEALCVISPFSRDPIKGTLKGVTNGLSDPSCDVIRTSLMPLLRKFGVDGEASSLDIKKRGCLPDGGGEVLFRCRPVRNLTACQNVTRGKVKKVRGISYTCNVSPSNGVRVASSARGPLNNFLADVHVFTDHRTKSTSGKSPGFGVALVAETTEECLYSVDLCGEKGMAAEELGKKASFLLLDEIARGGCVQSSSQGVYLCLMALCPENVSTVLMGSLTVHAIGTLRCIRDIITVEAAFNVDRDSGLTRVMMKGVGFVNSAMGTQ